MCVGEREGCELWAMCLGALIDTYTTSGGKRGGKGTVGEAEKQRVETVSRLSELFYTLAGDDQLVQADEVPELR